MRHRAAGEINEWDRAGESVIEEKCRLVRVELVRQHTSRLQIGNLTRSEGDQFAHSLMKTRRRAES
jgi:hypothetical protein